MMVAERQIKQYELRGCRKARQGRSSTIILVVVGKQGKAEAARFLWLQESKERQKQYDFTQSLRGTYLPVGGAIPHTALCFHQTRLSHRQLSSVTRNPFSIRSPLTHTLACPVIYWLMHICCQIYSELLTSFRYYLVFVTLMWNTVEAVNMYLMLIKVFADHVHYFAIKAGVLAWGKQLHHHKIGHFTLSLNPKH